MPVFKADIKARIETTLRDKFRALAKTRGVTESVLLRRIILKEVEQTDGSLGLINPDSENVVVAQMTIRMPRFLIAALKERAKTRGMAASRWVAALVQSNLIRNPVMSDDEILKLRISNRELAAIGRNINQIARALNDTLQNSERLPLDKLADLGRVIAENRAAIRALVRASQNAWEVE